MNPLDYPPPQPRQGRRLRSRLSILLAFACIASSGCQVAVMTGRILFGDPTVTPPFEVTTGVSPSKDEKKLAFVCTSPEFLSTDYSTLSIDLQEEINRRLTLKKVAVVPTDHVQDIIDENGGRFHLQDVGRKIDADYLVHIDVESFTQYEPGSRTLYRGRANGNIYAYEIRKDGGGQHIVEVFRREFRVEYPPTYPVPVDQTPEKVFRTRFVGNLSDELARYFYRYRQSELHY